MVSLVIDDVYRKRLALLESDDAKRRPERARRLSSFDQIFEPVSIKFFGGDDSLSVYHELRSSFVNGLYQATVLLASNCVEKELGAKLYARGITKAGDISISELCTISRALGEIETRLQDRIEELSCMRDAHSAFRPPIRDSKNFSFALHYKLGSHKLTEQDAVKALFVLAELLARPATTLET